MDPEPRQEAVVVPDVYQGLHAKYSGMLRGMFEYHQSVFLRNVNTFPTNFSLCNMGQGMVEGRFRVTDVYLQNPACEIIVTASNLSLDIYTNKSPETVANISQEFEGHFRKFSKNPNILLTLREGMDDFRVKIFNPNPSDHDWMSGILDSAFLAFAVAAWNKYEVLRRCFQEIAYLSFRKRLKDREQRPPSPEVILDLVNNGAAAQGPVVPRSGEGVGHRRPSDEVAGEIIESDDDIQAQIQGNGPARNLVVEGRFVGKRKQTHQTIAEQYEISYRGFPNVDKAVEEYWKRYEEIEEMNPHRPDVTKKRHLANNRGLLLRLEKLFEEKRTSAVYASLPFQTKQAMSAIHMSLHGSSTVEHLISILFPEGREYRLGGQYLDDWTTQPAFALYHTARDQYMTKTKQDVVEILRKDVRLNLEGLIPIAKSMENTEGLHTHVFTTESDCCLRIQFDRKQYTLSTRISDYKTFQCVISPGLDLADQNLLHRSIMPRLAKDLKKEILDISMTLIRRSFDTKLVVEKKHDNFLTTKDVSSMLVTMFAVVFKNEHMLNGPSIFELGESARDFAVSGRFAP